MDNMNVDVIMLYQYLLCRRFLDKLKQENLINNKQQKKIKDAVQKRLADNMN